MSLSKLALATFATLMGTATGAPAQQSPMPAEVAARLLELGRVVDPPKTALLYAPLQEKEPYPGEIGRASCRERVCAIV